MTEKLFRKKALEYQRTSIYGNVLLTTPFTFKALTLLSLIFALLIALFLFFAQHSRKVNVSGHLVPNQGIIQVLATSRGIIKKTLVVDGQHVQTGDILFIVATEKYTDNNQIFNDEIKNELTKRIENTKIKIKNERLFYDNEMAKNTNQIKTTQLDIRQIRQQIIAQKKLLELSHKQLRQHEVYFQKKLVLEEAVEIKKIAYLRAQTAHKEAQRLLLNKENELDNIERRAQQLPQERKNHLLDLENNLSQINQSFTEVQSSQAHIIRAPANGVIATIRLNLASQY